MTNEDIKKIVSGLIESQHKENEKSKIIDWLFKALIGVIVWIGIGLRNDVDILKQDVSKISTERVYSDRDMEAFKEFIAKPRFTKEDYDNYTTPLINSVNKNTLELNARSQFISDTEKRLLKLEYSIEEFKKKYR